MSHQLINKMALIINTQRFEFKDFEKISGNFDISSEEFSWISSIVIFLKSWYSGGDVELKTSGSTGTPKKIHLPKQTLINSAQMTNDFFGLNQSSKALLCLPATYIAGKMMLVRAIVGNYDLIAVKPQANPFDTIGFIPQADPQVINHIDFTALTPYQLLHSVESVKNISLGQVIVGGGQVSPELENMTMNLPVDFYETFGMTETASHIALRKFNVESQFTALRGVKISVDNRSCLIVEAPHLYPEPIFTNDVIEIAGKGNSFIWKGRYDRVVNSGGIKLFPEQIEKRIASIIQQACFVDSITDAALGQKLALFIESEQYSDSELNNLQASLLLVLSKYELPQEVFFYPHFVRSESNKILRAATIKAYF